jgi:hypothetical protein
MSTLRPVLRRMYGKRLRAYRKMGYSTAPQLEYAA